jgi:hypothetical protein
MSIFKKNFFLLALLLVNIESKSQVFPNSQEYRKAQNFYLNNPQYLTKYVKLINKDNYGKCLAIITEWDIAMISKQIDPDNQFKVVLAHQWVGLIESRKHLMSQGISDSQLNASVKSYASRFDIRKGGTDFTNWNTECINIAINSISK